MFEPKLVARAEIAAKQMRYFRVFSQRGSFIELAASAKRAGFEMTQQDTLERKASFHWLSKADRDFTFMVSFEDPEAVTVTAELHGDIYGLIMTSVSNIPRIGIEAKSSLVEDEFRENAQLFKKILLTFPDFDGGFADLLSRISDIREFGR